MGYTDSGVCFRWLEMAEEVISGTFLRTVSGDGWRRKAEIEGGLFRIGLSARGSDRS
jgi:hypothetical protein